MLGGHLFTVRFSEPGQEVDTRARGVSSRLRIAPYCEYHRLVENTHAQRHTHTHTNTLKLLHCFIVLIHKMLFRMSLRLLLLGLLPLNSRVLVSVSASRISFWVEVSECGLCYQWCSDITREVVLLLCFFSFKIHSSNLLLMFKLFHKFSYCLSLFQF